MHCLISYPFLGPDFVKTLQDEEYVYFFFREQAVEYINCGKVCGHFVFMKNSMQTFLKIFHSFTCLPLHPLH
jgi:hypothetical protein